MGSFPVWLVHYGSFSLVFFGPAVVVSGFTLFSIIHRAPFILNASFWVFFLHFFYPGPTSSFCGFDLFSVS